MGDLQRHCGGDHWASLPSCTEFLLHQCDGGYHIMSNNKTCFITVNTWSWTCTFFLCFPHVNVSEMEDVQALVWISHSFLLKFNSKYQIISCHRVRDMVHPGPSQGWHRETNNYTRGRQLKASRANVLLVLDSSLGQQTWIKRLVH